MRNLISFGATALAVACLALLPETGVRAQQPVRVDEPAARPSSGEVSPDLGETSLNRAKAFLDRAEGSLRRARAFLDRRNVAPTVKITRQAHAEAKADEPDSIFTLKFQWSDSVSGFDRDDITIDNGNENALAGGDNDSTWTMAVTAHQEFEGNLNVRIRARAVCRKADENECSAAASQRFPIDTKKPKRTGATVSRDTIWLTYSETLDVDGPDENAYSVNVVSKDNPTVTSVYVQGPRVRVLLNTPTAKGDTVLLTYNRPGELTADPLRDPAGNWAVGFENDTLTNLRQPPKLVPGQVSGLSASTDSTSITLTWQKPDTGTSNITGYDVHVSPDRGSNWSSLRAASSRETDTTYKHTPLARDTTLSYRVRAANNEGTGLWSTLITATTGGGTVSNKPGAPTNLTATADGETAIDLSWSAPSSDGGSAITGYEVEVSNTGSGGWSVRDTTAANTTSHRHTGLTAGTTRHYRVSAINANGEGPSTASVSATTAAAATRPDPPRNLKATVASSTQINLSWEAPSDDGGSDITGYRIEVSTDAGSNWALDGTTGPTVTTYEDTGLTANTTYRYRVRARNGEGDSDPSNEVSARTSANVPGAPTNLEATASGSSRIDLSWDEPGDDGGADITGYRIEITAEDGTKRTVTIGNSTTYAHTGLAAGSTWRYRVAATNSAGVGPWSGRVTESTAATIPSPPTSLTATKDGRHRINLLWQEPASDGGDAISGYEIQVLVHPDSAWGVLESNYTQFPDPYVHRGLAPGSWRSYRVRARNSAGTSRWSNEAEATTDAAPPGAPTNLEAAPNGPTQIDLTWTAPANDGGANITGYRILFSVTNGLTWNILLPTTGSDETSWSDTGLEPATSRQYRVRAINSQHIGPESNTAGATTDAVPPEAPTDLTATARGTSHIDLEWTAPSYTGGVPLAGYRVERSADGGSEWTVIVPSTASLATRYTDSGLDPATTRHYRVSAINTSDLVGDPSNVDFATTDATTPDPPTDLMAEADGTSRINLSWNAPAYDGGAQVTGYRIEVSPAPGLPWDELADVTGTTYTHTDLSPATTRHYRVRAVNEIGAGEPSNEAFATTDATVPDAPAGLTATAADHQQIDLDWDVPEFDGGAEITGYRIEVSENGGSTWTDLVADTEETTTSYAHTGLDPASTRHYRVRAINEIGESDASNVADATTDAIAPDPPTNLTATATQPTRIELSWTAPAYDGGAPITGYRIEQSPDGVAWTDLLTNTGVSLTQYADIGLTPGTTRHYRVSAINVAGVGLPSNAASATTDDPVDRAGRVNAAILPHFAAAATTSSLSAISRRIETVAARNPLRSQLSAAGLLSRAAGMGLNGSGGLDMGRLFDGTSFAMSLGGEGQAQDASTPAGFTTWGGADYISMGEPDGAGVKWDGNMLNVHLGADMRIHRDFLVGVAGSRASGNYDFTDVTGAREVAGTYEATLTSMNPYVAWLPGRTGVAAWAAGAFGWGSVAVEDTPAGRREGDTRSRGGALGATRILLNSGPSALRVRAEGWLSQVQVDGGEGMDSLTLDMHRVRIALEWSQVQQLPGGREVNFLAEGGLRYGDGDGTEGTGMELGGGVRFISGTKALTVEGHGRVLATSPGKYEEWGVRGLIQVNPQAMNRGLSMKIAPAWGQSASGVQELWEHGAAHRPDGIRALPRGRVNTQVEYGLGDFSGTPYGRLHLAEGGARAFGTGMRYSLTRVLDLRIEGTRTEGGSGPARHGLAMRGRWVF